MVGRRPRAVYWMNLDGKARPVFPCRRRINPTAFRYRDNDEEAARPQSNGPQDLHHAFDRTKVTRKTDFKDSEALVAEERRRADLKGRVLDGMRGFDLGELDRKFRKSDVELNNIQNKRVQNFYQAQNDTLDAWLEVDAVVYAVADDVIESMVNILSNCQTTEQNPRLTHKEPRCGSRWRSRAPYAPPRIPRRRRRFPSA